MLKCQIVIDLRRATIDHWNEVLEGQVSRFMWAEYDEWSCTGTLLVFFVTLIGKRGKLCSGCYLFSIILWVSFLLCCEITRPKGAVMIQSIASYRVTVRVGTEQQWVIMGYSLIVVVVFFLLLFVSLFVCSFVLHEEEINGRIHSTVEKLIYAIYMIALFVICAGRNDSSHTLTTASKKSFHRMNKYLVALLISQFYWHSCWKLLSTGHVSLSFFPRLLRQTYSVPQNDSRLSGP